MFVLGRPVLLDLDAQHRSCLTLGNEIANSILQLDGQLQEPRTGSGRFHWKDDVCVLGYIL